MVIHIKDIFQGEKGRGKVFTPGKMGMSIMADLSLIRSIE